MFLKLWACHRLGTDLPVQLQEYLLTLISSHVDAVQVVPG